MMNNFIKKNIFIIALLPLALLVYLYDLRENSLFFGDQAWFYLSARDLIINGNIPLLGITSSHTWLHQGPLWTYMLAPVLLISNFHPLSGFYLSVFMGMASLVMVYKIGKEFFSQRFAIIFSLLYAFSPLVIFHARLSYHTSPIPLVVLFLFYGMIRWIRGDIWYFPTVLLSISLLYNFELVTVAFVPIVVLYLLYGFFRKRKFVVSLFNKKIIAVSVLALIIPMIPVLIYDIQNGFPQTVVFVGWFGYKFLQFIGIFEKSPLDNSSFGLALEFFIAKYDQLIFIPKKYFSFLIFLTSFTITSLLVFRKKFITPIGIIFSLTLVGLIAYFLSGVPSEAYLIMLFPGLLFFLSFTLYQIKNNLVLVAILLIITAFNIYYLTSTKYLTSNSITLQQKINASDEILEHVNNKYVNLIYRGPGQEFQSSVMPYQYLIWWRGRVNESEKGVNILVEEREEDIIISTKDE